jgi:DNA-directed RNA polymerase subunit RPC12/RpoP
MPARYKPGSASGMAIQVNCVGCGKQFRAKDQFRNTKLKCPNCKADVLVQGPHVFGSDVFVSYSSADKSVADAVCGAIEGTKGLRCWMAPRDIPPGASWGSAIIEGIEDSRLMLLVFSEEANKSDQVLREVERAVAKKVPIVPLRIDKGPMRKDFEYFLAACHWIDATSGALEDHLAGLTRHIRHLLLDRAEVEADQKAYAPAPRAERVTASAAR